MCVFIWINISFFLTYFYDLICLFFLSFYQWHLFLSLVFKIHQSIGISLQNCGVSYSIFGTQAHFSPETLLSKYQTCSRKKGVEDRKVPFLFAGRWNVTLYCWAGLQDWVITDKQGCTGHLKDVWTYLLLRCGTFTAPSGNPWDRNIEDVKLNNLFILSGGSCDCVL